MNALPLATNFAFLASGERWHAPSSRTASSKNISRENRGRCIVWSRNIACLPIILNGLRLTAGTSKFMAHWNQCTPVSIASALYILYTPKVLGLFLTEHRNRMPKFGNSSVFLDGARNGVYRG